MCVCINFKSVFHFRFWNPHPEIFTLGNMCFVFRYCLESEQPTVFFRRFNPGAAESMQYTRMRMMVKDAEELCDQVEKLVAEIDSTEFGTTIPSLALLGEKACMPFKAKDFWDFGTWTSESMDVRCRPVQDLRKAVSMVVNTPRSSTKYGEGYIGPVYQFSLSQMRAIFPIIRANVKRYYENLD